MTRRRFAMLSAGLLGLGTAACGSRTPTYPVEGTLTVGGQPAPHARVILVPENADADAHRPSGVVGPDGRFRLSTFDANDGAPAGRYAVVAEWREPINGSLRRKAADKLGGKYSRPEVSKLHVEVKAGANVLDPIDLKPAPKAATAARPVARRVIR